ncbi:uncharacterized protein [Physcomitrium patens]|uniref:uncharacterized protein isoform X1 n=1 Tax=Physcomitrium patens TaxID=3218 RepID=UPI003CCD7A6E
MNVVCIHWERRTMPKEEPQPRARGGREADASPNRDSEAMLLPLRRHRSAVTAQLCHRACFACLLAFALSDPCSARLCVVFDHHGGQKWCYPCRQGADLWHGAAGDGVQSRPV